MDDRYSSIKSNQNNSHQSANSFSYNYNSSNNYSNGGAQFNIPESVLSDLCSRFIINMPVEERSDMIRMFFQIEIAHWFYLDFYCSNDDEEKYTSSSGGKDSGSSGGNTNSSTNNSSSSSISSSSEDVDDYDEYDENDLDEDSSGPKLIRQRNLTAAQNPLKQQLKPCSIRQFAENIFRYCPFLTQHTQHVDDILSKWRVFKHAVPTNGAIIMDEGMQHVLLVQGFWRNASWGFPKGKIFEEETESGCAVREVLEETGYDISSKLVEEEHLEININEQTIRLYLIGDVNKAATKFEPRTRREIKEVRWFAIDDLPQHRKDSVRCKQLFGYSTNAFFMVMPFVRALKKWISAKRASSEGQVVPGGHVSTVLKNYGHHRHHKLSRLPVTSSGGRVDRRNVHSNRRVNNNTYGQNSSYYNSSNYHSYFDSPSLNHASSQSSGFYKNQKSKSNENLFSASIKASPSLNNNISYNNKKSTPNNKTKGGLNGSNTKQMTNNNNNSIQKSPNSSSSQSSTSFSFNKLLESLESQSQSLQLQQQSPRQENTDEGLHYFQQLQNKEYSELLNNKQAAVTALANKTNNLAYVNKMNLNKQQQGQVKGKQAGNRARTVSLGIKDIKTENATSNVLEETSSAVSPRKQLNFAGPECWINFKFDYSALMQNLPPILDL